MHCQLLYAPFHMAVCVVCIRIACLLQASPMGDVMHGDGFGGSVPQQRVQPGGYPPPHQPGHVAMAGPRNQGAVLTVA